MANVGQYGKSLLVLILGTLFSLIISVVLATQVTKEMQVVLALLSEIIVILMSLGIFVYEINSKVLVLINESDIFSKAGMYALKTGDPIFSERFNSIKLELKELSDGHYILDDLPSVYRDDIESIKALKKGDSLLSMCPVGGSKKTILEQFSNKSFVAAMKEHFIAKDKKIDVQRIYIFEQKQTLKDIPEIAEHLKEAKLKKVEVRLIFLDDPRFKDARKLPRDYIVFGGNKVSVGRVGPNSNVDGADIYADRSTIERYKQKYSDLFRISEAYDIDD